MSDTLVVLFDKVAYTAKPSWQGARPEQVVYLRGTEVDAASFEDSVMGGERELQRLMDLGAVGSPRVLERTAAAVVTPAAMTDDGTVAYSDEELSRMKPENLAAIINQHPSSVDRIIRLEVLKGAKARKTVLALHPNYRDDATVKENVEELAGAVTPGEPSEDDGSTSGEAAPHVER